MTHRDATTRAAEREGRAHVGALLRAPTEPARLRRLICIAAGWGHEEAQAWAEDLGQAPIEGLDPATVLGEELGERAQRLWACDCVERVLHLFELDHPDDHRPREAIRVARLDALGEASKEELDAASCAAFSAESAPAKEAARTAARAAARAVVIGAAWHTAFTAARAAGWASARGATRIAAWDAERAWQTRRAADYLWAEVLRG